MAQHSDFLIIGGGIAGISAAARLSAEASVTVLEMEKSIGYHASGRSAAIFIRNYGNATIRALSAVSYDFLDNPVGVADSSLLSPRGKLMLATNEELPRLEAYLQDSSGMERVSPKEVAEIVPILRPEMLAAGAIEWGTKDIDVDRLMQGFARMLRGNAGQIVTDAVVTEISRVDGLWQVTTKQGIFRAKVIINAAGGWADPVAEMAGAARLSIQPLRRSAAIVPAPEGFDVAKWPSFGSIAEQWYAKPEAGKLMVSPAEEIPVDPHDVWADDMILAEGIDRYSQMVTTPVERVEHTWAGMRSFAPDRSLVIGFDSQVEGFFWLAGQGGYGIQTAAGASQLVADICLNRAPELSAEVVANLSPVRFSA